MFGNIKHFNAPGSTFNNASGDQFNTTGTSSSGMLGPMDPQWQRPLAAVRDSMPVARRAASTPMFSNIDTFQADNSIYNNSAGAQYNYNLVGSSSFHAPTPSHPHMGVTSAPIVRQPASAPPAPVQTAEPAELTELTPTMAEARMFGTITHFHSSNSEFNNSLGTQINVKYATGRTSPSVTSAASFPNNQNPFPGNHRPPAPLEQRPQEQRPPEQRPPEQRPPKISNPFSSKPKPTTPESSNPPNHTVDIALGVTDYVLSTLQTASRFSSVPFLPEAATAVLNILQGVQGAKENQGGFARLAAHGCNLISSVILVYEQREREGRELAPELVQSLGELVNKLRPIEQFVRERQQRHGFRGNIKRVILHKQEAALVQEYSEKLTQALAEFGLRSNINIQDGVAQIDKRLEELVAAMQGIGLQHMSPPASGPPSSVTTPSAPTGPSSGSDPAPPRPSSTPLASGSSSEPVMPTFAFTGPSPAPMSPPSMLTAPPTISSSAPASPFINHTLPPTGPPWMSVVGSVVNNVGGNQTNSSQNQHITLTGGNYVQNAWRSS